MSYFENISIKENGVVSTANSTATILDPAGVNIFTGTSEDVTNYGTIEISVYSNVASATDGLSIQFSSDGTNWDHTDTYTVPAGIGKNYSVQRVAQYFRIVYTNGSVIQTAFRLQVIFNKIYIKPSSHRTDDDITSQDDAELGISILKTVGSDPATFHTVDSQHPLPADGDSLYLKDINVTYSDNGGFSGVVTDYFDNLKTVNNDATATNPKVIKVWFNRTIQSHALGVGCDDLTKNFSNIKFKALGSGEEVRYTWDGSADSTKRNSYLIEMPSLTLNGFIIEFHTADEVGLSNLYMAKQIDTHATLSAVKSDGVVVDIGASDSGNLKVSNAENGLAIAKGDVTDTTFIHKFGFAPDFDSTDNEVTVWDGAEDGVAWELMNYVYSTTADIDSISSSDAGDTEDIVVVGLDTNWATVEQTITLTGQTRVALTTPLIRVFRAYNDSSTPIVGHVAIYVNTALTAGIPTDATKIRAIVQPEHQQTLMAVYSVPAGYTAYMRDWYAGLAGASRTSEYIVKVKARLFGKVFRTKHVSSLAENGTSYNQHKYEEPEVFPAKTDIEMTVDLTAAGATAAAFSAGFDIVLVAD
jgi:hypothetical protein